MGPGGFLRFGSTDSMRDFPGNTERTPSNFVDRSLRDCRA
jgi:hypothetical protein